MSGTPREMHRWLDRDPRGSRLAHDPFEQPAVPRRGPAQPGSAAAPVRLRFDHEPRLGVGGVEVLVPVSRPGAGVFLGGATDTRRLPGAARRCVRNSAISFSPKSDSRLPANSAGRSNGVLFSSLFV